ncbi:MAG: phosphonopyruvate decarboxylase, partial [Sediminibacterium sp.]|nr:phosphonopyruvate decarboxylase [Sediminibacterium sp.]
MIRPAYFFDLLQKAGIVFFSGVPDSLLKNFCDCIEDNARSVKHIICANEGTAVSLAVGYNLATGKLPMIYLQNSGLGNIINPVLSIADNKVYSIPMILLIGWRGEPDVKDEPQHISQGALSEALLNAIQIPYLILDETQDPVKAINQAVNIANERSKPFALLVRDKTFEKYVFAEIEKNSFELKREDAVKIIMDQLGSDDIIVSTTGKTCREVFEYREFLQQSHEQDFLTVGAMGHASSIAMGIAMEKPQKNVYCFDGDGSVIMHMGSMAINGSMKNVYNFKHIVINNGAHDSVGGQATVGFDIDLTA